MVITFEEVILSLIVLDCNENSCKCGLKSNDTSLNKQKNAQTPCVTGLRFYTNMQKKKTSYLAQIHGDCRCVKMLQILT